jgi:hypothetical protein
MPFTKGKSGNPNGKPKGTKQKNSINESLRLAVEKAAKGANKSIGDYLWGMYNDSKWHAKLIDKFISDAPKDVNVSGDLTVNVVNYADTPV